MIKEDGLKRCEPFSMIQVALENGWGNIMLELTTGIILAKKLNIPDPCAQIIGWISPLFLLTHNCVFSLQHQDYGLPYPDNLSKMIPGINFQTHADQTNALHYDFHQPFDLPILSKHSNIILRADWMSLNVQLLLSNLLDCINIFNCFKPSDVITKYIHSKYFTDNDLSSTVAVHVRVRQPGDIMSQIKHPTPDWFSNAVSIAKPEIFTRIIIVSGISTAHDDGKTYLSQIFDSLSSSFQSIKIITMTDEPLYIDFFLLTMMKHLVITNSTFSFMSAVLGSCWNSTKIVAPTCLANEFGIDTSNPQIPNFTYLPTNQCVNAWGRLAPP